MSTQRLLRELELARALKADYLVVHPGHGPLELAIAQVARALALAVSPVPPPPWCSWKTLPVRARNWAGASSTCARIITESGVPLGLCLDTAHAHGAGYDLSSPPGVARLLADLARGPGLDAVKIIHLNDSRVPLNSRRDRHWHLGRGAIGLPGLRHLLSHPWLKPEAAILRDPATAPGL